MRIALIHHTSSLRLARNRSAGHRHRSPAPYADDDATSWPLPSSRSATTTTQSARSDYVAPIAYQDSFPFKDRPPDEVHHVGMTPTAQEEIGPRTGDPAQRASLAGREAEYRLVFQSMSLPGLPEELKVGRVRIVQTDGPVWSQTTHIVQQPGYRPVYRKWMEHAPVGKGYRLTVCLLPVTLTENLSASIVGWRDEVLAGLSLVVALFDERIAQVELAEDIIAEKRGSGDKTHVIDTRVGLREFPPTSRVRRADLPILSELARLDTSRDDPMLAAGRWYLRAAQAGPTPDAVVYLWIALEALSKPPWGTKLSKAEKRRPDVDWVEQAIAATGFDLELLDPDIGRLAGLRAEIVHGGVESPALLRPGYYCLEAMARLLLRARAEMGVAGWPLQPGVPNRRGPFRVLALLGYNFRRIVWQDPY